MARPQQPTIFKASAYQNCNIPRTYGPGKKNLQPTKYAKSEGGFEEDIYLHPEVETVKTRELCEIIIPFNHNRKIFSDITGAFLDN